MVWEGLDGLWAWGSVTQASKFLQNIHPKSVVTDWRALMKASGSEGKVWTVRAVCCLRWSHRVTAEPLGWGGGIGQVHSLCLLSAIWTWFEDKQISLFSPGNPDPNPFNLNSNPLWLSQPGRFCCLFSTSCQKTICPAESSPDDCSLWEVYRLCEAWHITCAHVLPPSLSFPSPHAVSMEVSQPAPLQPSWQTQCQPFMSRVHLPLPLHKPGHPSARQTATRSNALETQSNAAWKRPH